MTSGLGTVGEVLGLVERVSTFFVDNEPTGSYISLMYANVTSRQFNPAFPSTVGSGNNDRRAMTGSNSKASSNIRGTDVRRVTWGNENKTKINYSCVRLNASFIR